MGAVETLKNELAGTPQTQRQMTVFDFLKNHKDQIIKALPRHMSADRMLRLVTTEIRNTPKLGACDPTSLFGAVIQASQLGLEPCGALGHAYLVPYKTTAKLIIGYRGLIELARRSGQIISITANAVYKEDHFCYEFGLSPTLSHRPNFEGREWDDKPVYVYAVAELRDGGKQFVVLHRSEIERIRARTATKKSKDNNNYESMTPWDTDYEEMAKKTAVRRLFKLLPVSVEAAQAAAINETDEINIDNILQIEGDANAESE